MSQVAAKKMIVHFAMKLSQQAHSHASDVKTLAAQMRQMADLAEAESGNIQEQIGASVCGYSRSTPELPRVRG